MLSWSVFIVQASRVLITSRSWHPQANLRYNLVSATLLAWAASLKIHIKFNTTKDTSFLKLWSITWWKCSKNIVTRRLQNRTSMCAFCQWNIFNFSIRNFSPNGFEQQRIINIIGSNLWKVLCCWCYSNKKFLAFGSSTVELRMRHTYI